MSKKAKKILKAVLFTAAGGAGGFLYYYFVGCPGGSCALASNPYITTCMFGFVGWLLSGVSFKEKDDKCNT